MKLYGLTGGIACGKSTVAEVLRRDHGVVIIDCDAIVRDLQRPGTSVTRAIARAFPGVVDPATGELHRQKLAELVFSDAVARKKLASIMNWPIKISILTSLLRAWWTLSHDALVVLDAPLLFETRVLAPLCSGVVVVGCAETAQVSRLQSRNGLTEEASRQRIAAQMPLSLKVAKADYVLWNDGTVSDLEAKVAHAVAWMTRQHTLHKARNRVRIATLSLCVALALVAWRR